MKKKNSMKWLIGGLVIGAAVISISFMNLGDNLVYFYTPSEAQAKANELDEQNIKVGGMVVPGSVKWEAEQLALSFTISDLKGHDIQVSHKGTPPDMFKEGQGVVVEGRIASDGRTLVSQHLLVKHSEEYKKPGDHSDMNKALLEKSLFKE